MIRFEFAVAADLAANLLSVCLVVFLTLVPLAGRRDAPAPPDLARSLLASERRALDGPAMIALLHARQAAPATVTIDLYADRVERRAPGEAMRPVDPNADLTQRGGSVALFVLDAAFYADVRRSLARSGAVVEEMSVPDALRDPASPRLRFSQGFLALDAAPRPLPDFTRDLARLLEAAAEAKAGKAAGGAVSEPHAVALTARFQAAGLAALRFGLPLTLLVLIALAERRWRRRAVPFVTRIAHRPP